MPYLVYSSCPMDHLDGYVHVSEISQHLEKYIRNHPRTSMTFSEMWCEILEKLYWAWTKSKNIDLDLRQPDFWIRLIADEQHVHEIFLIFKADNNGTMYAIMRDRLDADQFASIHLVHEFDCEWTKESLKI